MTPRQRNEDAHTPTTDFIDALRAKRERLALVLEENDGLRDLLAQQLYPDRAHLLYELLQNAEDCGATTVEFELQPDRLLVRHDGRPFTEADFTGITAIAQGTKRDDDRTIGRFGIGFKAVFAYTATPAVRCGGDHVQIRDMVLPHRMSPVPLPKGWTQFEFPFDAIPNAELSRLPRRALRGTQTHLPPSRPRSEHGGRSGGGLCGIRGCGDPAERASGLQRNSTSIRGAAAHPNRRFPVVRPDPAVAAASPGARVAASGPECPLGDSRARPRPTGRCRTHGREGRIGESEHRRA